MYGLLYTETVLGTSTMAKLEPLAFWMCVSREIQIFLFFFILIFFQRHINKGLKKLPLNKKLKRQTHFNRIFDGSREAFGASDRL